MFISRKKIFSDSAVYFYTLAAFLIMALTALFFPLEFSVYRDTDLFAPFWNAVTETGGFAAGMILMLMLILYLTIRLKIDSGKFYDLSIFVSVAFLVFVFSMGFSQWYMKDFFKKPRPYQLYFVEKGILSNRGEQFFSMPQTEKSKFLEEVTRNNNELLKEVYKPVLNNWISNSGFSFPSGHAQTSFYFAVIFSYVFFKTFRKEKKYLGFVPFIWAILVSLSRVILGFHYPADVIAGALAGMSSGFIAISFPALSKFSGRGSVKNSKNF